MSIDYVKANEDIVQDSKDLVFSQFVNSDNVQKLIEIIAEEAKSYEEVAEKVFTTFLLSNATGVTLDSIGEFFNFPRDGRNDDAYRTALVVSAIGSNSKITRDSIYNLVEIATGGLGGLFYNGRYHDLYMYLQDACVERTIAAEFINKYLPANTQASVLFESGNSFGFEDNGNARGFSKVYQSAGEGTAFVEISYATASGEIAPILPRAFEFIGTNGYTYRTEFEVSLENNIQALYWDIPSGYVTGDTLTINARDNISRELYTDSLTIVDTGTSRSEIATFLSDFFTTNNIVSIENVTEDTTLGHEIYIGFEDGLVAPVDGARVRGFNSKFTILLTAKNTSDLSLYSSVNVINTTKGVIEGPWGLQLNPVESPDTFEILSTQVGPDFDDGFGEEGLVIPEESFSEAGGFCTRASLTSRDILGFGTFVSPEDLDYDLDSKLSEVVGLSKYSEFDNFKTPRFSGEYNTYSPHEWDVSLSAAPFPRSESVVLKSPSGVEAVSIYEQIDEAASGIVDQPSVYGNLDLDASDINFPVKPYYYEVDFPKLVNSAAIDNCSTRMFAKSFETRTSLVNSETVVAVTKDGHSLVVNNGYNFSGGNFVIRIRANNNATKYTYNFDTEQFDDNSTYSALAEEDLFTYSDATLESPKTIGVYYDPISRTYTVYVDGVEYNGTDGLLRYTIFTGADTTGSSPGDVYVTPPWYPNSGIFEEYFKVDNSEPEPATEDDYGAVNFIYNREDLKYTSQLPPNTVDIFGRRITQEI